MFPSADRDTRSGVGEWYKLCNDCAVGAVAFICNGFGHLAEKELEYIVVMMVARMIEAMETIMMRLGATMASRSASVDVGMECSEMESGGKQLRCENHKMPRPLRPFPT